MMSNRNKKIMKNIFSSWIGKHYKSNQQRNSEPAANIFLIVLILLRVTLYPLNAKVYFFSNEAMGDLKSLFPKRLYCYYQRKKHNPQVSIIIMTTEKSLELGLENLGLSSSFVTYQLFYETVWKITYLTFKSSSCKMWTILSVSFILIRKP